MSGLRGGWAFLGCTRRNGTEHGQGGEPARASPRKMETMEHASRYRMDGVNIRNNLILDRVP
jgi:hypothetical protein